MSPPRLNGAGALPVRDASGRPLIRMQTLGAAAVLVGEIRLTAAAGTLFSLLVRLTGAPGMQLSRDVLRRALWPNQEEPRQRGNLRQALYKLRGYGVQVAMQGDVVSMDSTQVVRTFSLDRTAETFERDVTMGHEPFGPYLQGFVVPWPELQTWIDEQRETVHADVRRVLADQLRRRKERADWGGADALARWLLQFDPLNEEATLTIAECTALSGSKHEALAIIDRYLAELGPCAGDLRLQATVLRRRIAEPAARSRLSFAATERHFVGREQELAELTMSMRRARWHDGSAVLLHGPAGIGKTRLVHELEKVATIEGVKIAHASCRESDLLRPLSVFLDLVPDLLNRPGALGCAPESLAVLRRLLPFGNVEVKAPTGPVIDGDAVVSTSTQREELSHEWTEAAALREPMPMAATLRRAIIDLIAAISEEKPFLLVFEDVHWIDEMSWDVLSDLTDRSDKMSVFLLLTSRTPHARPSRPQRIPLALRALALHPLSAERCMELSRAIGDDLSAPISNDLGEWFVNASEGIPLFLRTLVNHWIETGAAGGVPPTIQSVIDQRLSQVGSESLRVLQTAALLGRWASADRVARVLDIGFHRLIESVDRLTSLGTLREHASQTLEVHELVRQVALAALPVTTRTLLSGRIADDLSSELCFPETPSEIEAIDHFVEAGIPEKAEEFARHALQTLLRMELPHRAVSVGNHALHQLPRLAFEVQFKRLRRDALYSAGQYSKLLSDHDWDSSVPEATASWDLANARDVVRMVEIADRAMYVGDFIELCSRGLLIARTPTLDPSVRLRASIAVIRASSMGVSCEVPHAAYAVGRSILESNTSDLVAGDELEMYFHTPFGQHAAAVAAANRLLRNVTSRPTPSDQVRLQGDCGYALMCAGLFSEATEVFRVTRQMALDNGILTRASAASFNESIIDIAQDRLDLAEGHALDARQIAAQASDPFLESLSLRNLSRIAQLSGEFSRARTWLDESENYKNIAAHPKWHAFGIALKLGLAIGESDEATISRMLPLATAELRLHQAALGQDFLASRVILGLMEASEVQLAKHTIREYVTVHRREAFAPPTFLRGLEVALEAR